MPLLCLLYSRSYDCHDDCMHSCRLVAAYLSVRKRKKKKQSDLAEDGDVPDGKAMEWDGTTEDMMRGAQEVQR